MDEATLLALLRYGFLAALYLFLGAVILAIYRDLRVTAGGGYVAPGQVDEIVEPEPAPAKPPHQPAALAVLEQVAGDPLPGGHVFAITAPVFTVGRRADCDLVLPAPNVSGQHFRLHLGQAGASLEDMASTNGTFRNGERVLGRVDLAPGDEITAGPYSFTFAPPRQ